MMIANKIIQAVYTCFYVYSLMIIARCLLTWLPNVNWDNPIMAGLKSSVDLYLNVFKKIIPPIGMFDFSPILAIFLLYPLNWVVVKLLELIFGILGMLG